MPMQLGPIIRMPLARAAATIRCWRATPSGPASAKPALKTTADFTPRRAQASIAGVASSAPTAMMAQSTSPGTSSMVG